MSHWSIDDVASDIQRGLSEHHGIPVKVTIDLDKPHLSDGTLRIYYTIGIEFPLFRGTENAWAAFQKEIMAAKNK